MFCSGDHYTDRSRERVILLDIFFINLLLILYMCFTICPRGLRGLYNIVSARLPLTHGRKMPNLEERTYHCATSQEKHYRYQHVSGSISNVLSNIASPLNLSSVCTALCNILKVQKIIFMSETFLKCHWSVLITTYAATQRGTTELMHLRTCQQLPWLISTDMDEQVKRQWKSSSESLSQRIRGLIPQKWHSIDDEYDCTYSIPLHLESEYVLLRTSWLIDSAELQQTPPSENNSITSANDCLLQNKCVH